MSGPRRNPLRSIEVGVRRVLGLDAAAPLPDSEPRLLAAIRAEIEAAGPMTFARFMELALYDPTAGYYMTSGPGREADYLTAPEGHPIFGWALARHLESVWLALGRPKRFTVREHGAGSGALAAAVLDGLRRSGSQLLAAVRYQAVERSASRLEELRERLASLGLAASLEPATGEPAIGAVIANELLDALPVHRVIGGPDGSLRELYVDAAPGGGLQAVEGALSTPALAVRLEREAVRLAPGQPAEVCLALDAWVAEAAGTIASGELLVIDYGHPAAELYRTERGSSLRAYQRHRVHADPFAAIGRQDLTAHVDLTALEQAAAAAGLQAVGHARQADFLATLGIGELLVGLQSQPGTSLEGYLEARSAVVRMLDPRATGAFHVAAFGRALQPGAIAGFGGPIDRAPAEAEPSR